MDNWLVIEYLPDMTTEVSRFLDEDAARDFALSSRASGHPRSVARVTLHIGVGTDAPEHSYYGARFGLCECAECAR